MVKKSIVLMALMSCSTIGLQAKSGVLFEINLKPLFTGAWSLIKFPVIPIRGIASGLSTIAHYFSGHSLADIRTQCVAAHAKKLEEAIRWEKVQNIVKLRDLQADLNRKLSEAKTTQEGLELRLRALEKNQSVMTAGQVAHAQEVAQHRAAMANELRLANDHLEQERRRFAIISRPTRISAIRSNTTLVNSELLSRVFSDVFVPN